MKLRRKGNSNLVKRKKTVFFVFLNIKRDTYFGPESYDFGFESSISLNQYFEVKTVLVYLFLDIK